MKPKIDYLWTTWAVSDLFVHTKAKKSCLDVANKFARRKHALRSEDPLDDTKTPCGDNLFE